MSHHSLKSAQKVKLSLPAYLAVIGSRFIFGLLLLSLSSSAQATDYSSTNFFVRDPSMNQGGTSNATSTNFQLRGSLGEAAGGRSTSTNFADQTGFQNYSDSSAYTQAGYRFANNLNSTSVTYTGAPAQDSVLTVATTGQQIRLRLLIHVDNSDLTLSGQQFKLQFGEKPAGGCSAASFADLATGSGVIRYYNNATPSDAATLTGVAGDPSHSGHTTVNQSYEESNNFTNSVAAIPAGQDGLWDFSLENNSAVAGKRYCFRAVQSDNTALSSYAQYPEILIDEELTFSLDATSKSFGTITPGSAPTDQSSTVTTTTNATSGYQVTMWATQLLTRGSATIANWSGTNTAPTSFSGAGDSRFGYTTSDTNLGGGTANRFSTGTLFSGFALAGPGDPVADSSAGPVIGESYSLTYRFRSATTQNAGTYTTTLVLINTATY